MAIRKGGQAEDSRDPQEAEDWEDEECPTSDHGHADEIMIKSSDGIVRDIALCDTKLFWALSIVVMGRLV